MNVIRFADAESKKRAIEFLIDRFPTENIGEKVLAVPDEALKKLSENGFGFIPEGKHKPRLVRRCPEIVGENDPKSVRSHPESVRNDPLLSEFYRRRLPKGGGIPKGGDNLHPEKPK